MTKLLNRDRDVLYQAIIDDLPVKDYSEQAKKAATAAALKLCPPAIRRAWEDNVTQTWVERNYCHFDSVGSVTVPCPNDYNDQRDFFAKLRVDPAVVKLVKAAKEQEEKLSKLRIEIRANLNACFTREVFKERFPALAGYLPEIVKVTPTAQVPATTNLLEHLTDFGLKLPKKAA